MELEEAIKQSKVQKAFRVKILHDIETRVVGCTTFGFMTSKIRKSSGDIIVHRDSYFEEVTKYLDWKPL